MGKQKTVITAGFITLVVGVVNSFVQKKQWPSGRFLIGTGIVFFVLSALAESEAEMANALATAIAVFAVLGEGGGIADHFTPRGELDTQRQKAAAPVEVRRPAHTNAVQGFGPNIGIRPLVIPGIPGNG